MGRVRSRETAVKAAFAVSSKKGRAAESLSAVRPHGIPCRALKSDPFQVCR